VKLDVTLGNATMKPMYVKLFNQILTSSIANDRRLRHFFTDLLLCADARGLVMMTPQAISRVTGADMDEVSWGLAELEKPDPFSRTPDMDGRRIERLGGVGYGWRIINYEQYRGFKDADQLREATRIRVARHRAKEAESTKKPVKRNVTRNACNSITEGEGEVEVEAEGTNTCPANAGQVEVKPLSAVDEVVQHYLTYHPRSRPGKAERTLIAARLKEGFTVDQLRQAIDGQHRSPYHLGKNDRGATYLGLELAMRNSSKVNQFLEIVERPPTEGDVGAMVDRVADRIFGDSP